MNLYLMGCSVSVVYLGNGGCCCSSLFDGFTCSLTGTGGRRMASHLITKRKKAALAGSPTKALCTWTSPSMETRESTSVLLKISMGCLSPIQWVCEDQVCRYSFFILFKLIGNRDVTNIRPFYRILSWPNALDICQIHTLNI